MADHPTYRRFCELCLALPDTRVTMTWGSPHLRVGDKIFTGWSRWPDDLGWSFSVKLDKDKQAALVASDPRFAVAPYVGKHGWVAVTIADGREDWSEIAALVEEGYRNIAGPKRAARSGAAAMSPVAKAVAKPRAAAKPNAKPVAKPNAKAKPVAKAKKPTAARPAKPARRAR